MGVVPDGDGRSAVLNTIAARICGDDLRHPVRVAVDGITSSGKSTFADALALVVAQRGRPTIRVTMDGFHHRRARRHRQGRLSGDGYYEDAYDLGAAVRELLIPLGPNGSRCYLERIIDLASDEPVDDARRTASSDSVLIVDGSFLQRPEIRDHWDHVVYLDVAFPLAEQRGVERERDTLGGREAAAEAFRQRYHAAGHRYIREVEPLHLATFVVDNDDPDHPQLTATR